MLLDIIPDTCEIICGNGLVVSWWCIGSGVGLDLNVVNDNYRSKWW